MRDDPRHEQTRHDEPRHEEVRQAEDLLPHRLLLVVGLATLAAVVALCALAWRLTTAREAELRPGRVFPEAALGPPRLLAGIDAEPFELVRARPSLTEAKAQALDGYGWVDRRRGLVRIPVEQAIDLLVQQKGARP